MELLFDERVQKIHTSITFRLPILTRLTEYKWLVFIKGDDNE